MFLGFKIRVCGRLKSSSNCFRDRDKRREPDSSDQPTDWSGNLGNDFRRSRWTLFDSCFERGSQMIEILSGRPLTECFMIIAFNQLNTLSDIGNRSKFHFASTFDSVN